MAGMQELPSIAFEAKDAKSKHYQAGILFV